MDENKNLGEEFSLEDILNEFGSEKEHPENSEDMRIWGEPAPEQPVAEEMQDTVRLDEITKAVHKQTEVTEETIAFTPVNAEPEEDVYIPPVPEEEKVEPYSDEWEPEYEQPIGEYIPPEPIVFRPKSRLRELKRKLVAGPEKRYYEISEQGFGKLQAAIFANLLVAIATAASTAMFALGTVGEHRIRFVVFVQFLSLLLSALLGSYQLMEGFTDILKRRFSLNSLLIFSLLACLIDGVLCLYQVRIPCCALFSINMTMSLWSTYHKRSKELGQMDTMRKATHLDSVVSVPDYYEGRPGFLRGEGQVEDFMDTYQSSSRLEKTLSTYALVALLVSIGIGVIGGVLHGITTGVQAFSAALLVAMPATAYITLSRPAAILERRLHKLGTVICGWRGVKKLSASAVFPVNDLDLFPAGAAKLNGVKFYGQREPDTVVSYSAALMEACGGGMAPLFSQLLESRNGYHYEALGIQYYPGGVGAEVNEEAVLAGTLAFMQDMGVDMPEGTRVNQAIYVAIDGCLSGVFAISYAKTKSATTGLTTLCAYKGLTPVLTSLDFMLTEGFLRGKFGVNTRKMAFPDPKTCRSLAEIQPQEDAEALALTTQEGLAGAAYAVTGARALRLACTAGVVVHMLGGILGLVIMLILAVMGTQHLLTPTNVILYELLWMVPGLLLTEWTRPV